MNLFHSSRQILSNALLIIFLSSLNLTGHITLALPQSGTVPPEFQCYRLCYPWKTECNSISYLVEESPTCWRCCLIPTNATTTTTTTTSAATTTLKAYSMTQG